MASMPALESPEQTISLRDEDREPSGGRWVAVFGTWMAILGAIRLACEIAGYIGSGREAWGSGLIASRGWGWFVTANPPLTLALGAWPLMLGLALRRTRWRELVAAGALTFLILSVGGLLTALADLGQSPGRWITIGSLRVPKTAWAQLPAAGVALAGAGAALLLLEFVTAIVGLTLALRQDKDEVAADRSEASLRSWLSRLAVGVSIALLLMTIRLPAWSTYLELLSQSQWFREFILRDDMARIRSTRRALLAESEWAAQARVLLDEAEEAWRAGRYVEASEHYTKLEALLNKIPTSNMSLGERKLAAESLNNWAWLQATCPESALRNYEGSVACARRALELEPNAPHMWNTLGVAYFRLGAWDDAMSALYRSMELHDEGNSADWYFLAMIHERLGHKDRAREWYDKAVKWAHGAAPGNEELYRFEVEAAETLGLPKPDKPAPPAFRAPPRPFGPLPLPGRRGRMGPRLGGNAPSPNAAATPVGIMR